MFLSHYKDPKFNGGLPFLPTHFQPPPNMPTVRKRKVRAPSFCNSSHTDPFDRLLTSPLLVTASVRRVPGESPLLLLRLHHKTEGFPHLPRR